MPDQITQQAFGRFLKFWRKLHKLSQEELAFRLNSSPRHISRLENDSSRPSESMVKEIAEVLELGERDSNHLLISAGYAAVIKNVNFNAPELKWLRNTMMLNLRALDPYPTVLLDNSTNILMVNKAWVGFYSNFIPREVLAKVSNLYDFLFSRQGAGNTLTGWENILSVILMSIQQRALFSDDSNDYKLLERLVAHPTVPEDWQQRAAKLEPMASFRTQVNINGALKHFFSVNSTVSALGPTAYASEPQLTINTLLPEDEDLDLSIFTRSNISHPLLFY